MKTMPWLIGLFVASAALAHEGPRFWVDVEDGRVVTYTSDNDLNPTVYSPCRLFTTQFNLFFGIYTTEFPGFEVIREGANTPPGTTFGFRIAGPLLVYDEERGGFRTTLDSFGPPAPQVAISLGAQLRVSAATPVAGFNFFNYTQSGDHSHLAFTFFGNGASASNGPAGVYALPLRLTAGGYATSERFYLLIGKEVSEESELFEEALAAAERMLILERPTTIVTVGGSQTPIAP